MRLTFICLAVAGTLLPAPVKAATPSARAPHSAVVKKDLSRLFNGYSGTFVLRDLSTGRTIYHNARRAEKRLSPCSTFKIINSLIALETGVASGPDYLLRWDGVKRSREELNHDLTLHQAIQVSAVWYFQELAKKIGKERMQKYLDAIPYGNHDTSGGLTKFWLETSLTVSAEEQVDIMERLQRGDLPFSQKTQQTVREMLRLPTPKGTRPGTILRGKTGSGGNAKVNTIGWFVGTVERGGKSWAFAVSIDENPKHPTKGALGLRSRGIAMQLLAHEGIL